MTTKITFGKMQGNGDIQDGKDAHIYINGDRRGQLTSIVAGSGTFGSEAPFRVVSYAVEIWGDDLNEVGCKEWDIRVVSGGWQSQNTDKVLMTPSAAKREIKLWIAEQINK